MVFGAVADASIASDSVARRARAALGDICPMQAALALRDLRRDYNQRPVLREVSIELEAGRTLVVIGPNGAGKTHPAAHRRRPCSARPRASSRCSARSSRARPGGRAGKIGYLGHSPLLYRELSVAENLEFNARLHGIAEPRQPDRRAARPRRDRPPGDREGSQPVRRAAAAGLDLPRPAARARPLLVLDEPRSHLDLGAVSVVDELLGPEPGRTRVIVTHEIDSGLAAADALLALRADGSSPTPAPAPSSTWPTRGRSSRGAREGLPRRRARQGRAHRAAHARVGAGDGAVQRHHLRPLSLRPRPRAARGQPRRGRAAGDDPVRGDPRDQPRLRQRARAGRLRRDPPRPGRRDRALRGEGLDPDHLSGGASR